MSYHLVGIWGTLSINFLSTCVMLATLGSRRTCHVSDHLAETTTRYGGFLHWESDKSSLIPHKEYEASRFCFSRLVITFLVLDSVFLIMPPVNNFGFFLTAMSLLTQSSSCKNFKMCIVYTHTINAQELTYKKETSPAAPPPLSIHPRGNHYFHFFCVYPSGLGVF